MLKATVLGEKVMKKVKGGASSTSCFCGPLNFCFCPLFWNYDGKYTACKWDMEANQDADTPLQ